MRPNNLERIASMCHQRMITTVTSPYFWKCFFELWKTPFSVSSHCPEYPEPFRQGLPPVHVRNGCRGGQKQQKEKWLWQAATVFVKFIQVLFESQFSQLNLVPHFDERTLKSCSGYTVGSRVKAHGENDLNSWYSFSKSCFRNDLYSRVGSWDAN